MLATAQHTSLFFTFLPAHTMYVIEDVVKQRMAYNIMEAHREAEDFTQPHP
jgi:hypothetical protein